MVMKYFIRNIGIPAWFIRLFVSFDLNKEPSDPASLSFNPYQQGEGAEW